MVPKDDIPLRLADPNDPGAMPFYELLRDRCQGDRLKAERLTAFLHQWDYLADELGHSPTPPEYSPKWSVPRPSAYRLAEEFREVFPTEQDPARLLRLLWDGMTAQPSHLFSVRVVQHDFEAAR